MRTQVIFRYFAVALLTAFISQKSFSQCFQIESILVDACGAQEGLNEMVRFKAGSSALNCNTMVVVWPNNPWQGIIQNATTAGKTAALNADINAAGGCGQLIEPPGGIIPANATAILVTSFNLDTALNPFGAITNDIYIIYQNNPTTVGGHFANFGTGLRTLSMVFGACVDTVTYDRALLTTETGTLGAANGATVLFDNSGNPEYINNGCNAPVPPFAVDAGQPISACAGSTISLSGTVVGQQSVSWSAPAGTFSAISNPATNYTLPANATGTITLTLTATNICNATISDTVLITVTSPSTPNFATSLSLCNGATPPALATTSPNGITGSWNPSAISNTASGNYVFTPNPNQCATPVTLSVAITNSIVPNFNTSLTICNGATPPALATTSPNGITGSWNPSTISNTASGNYVFTPNPNQCATPVTLSVMVTNSIVPNFNTSQTICNGATPPALATTSPNGITGSWNPSTISNTASGNYVFTPNPNQCATPVTLSVAVTNSIVPNFNTSLTICNGATPPALATTSPNGITGSWNPSAISNTASGNYVFTPNPNQCAAPVTLSVTVTNSIVPNFNTSLTICNGATPPALATTSPNGITGSWNPSTISNTASGNYVFTPNPNQCATPVTLSVTVTNSIVPNFNTSLTICNGATPPVLATTSPNGITGSWNPSTISNTASGNYVFTPNPNQCATPVTLSVAVTNSIVPNFNTSLTICNGATPPVLATTSPNGITGSWNPSTISNTASGNYVFTPNPNQCATPVTLSVTVTSFAFEVEQYCAGGSYILNPLISSGDNDYVWTNGSSVVGNDPSFNVTQWANLHPEMQLPYNFTLTVNTPEGCSSAKTVTVNRIFCDIPKGISPNADGYNDQFDLTGLNVRRLSLFNRYGVKVFAKTNYTDEWHGQSDSGHNLPDGTYYYVIENGSGNPITGWVYLISKS